MKKLLILFIGFSLMVSVSISHSQETNRGTSAESDSLRRQMLDEDWFYRTWTSEPLSGNNKPFHDTRMGLRRLGKTEALKIKLPVFAKEAQSNPDDARLQYRWVTGNIFCLLSTRSKREILPCTQIPLNGSGPRTGHMILTDLKQNILW